ncbi:MAG: alpha/beta hydrolase-fold protein [Pseudomarimonas sp.]
MHQIRFVSTSKLFALIAVLLALFGCGNLGNPELPIPTKTILGKGEPDQKTLVIVLPGRRDNVEVMQEYGVAEAIHAGWPEVDVQLTSATLAYYMDGGLAARMRRQLLEPARAEGYQRIVVMGASMGGMGSLIVDQANPGMLDHVVLMAPYLGERKLLSEIADAGGVLEWQAGPEPAAMDSDNFERELWRHIQNVGRDAQSRARIWLAYGADDRLANTVPVIAPALDAAQILPRDGGHNWVVWNGAATDVFSRLRKQAVECADCSGPSLR